MKIYEVERGCKYKDILFVEKANQYHPGMLLSEQNWQDMISLVQRNFKF